MVVGGFGAGGCCGVGVDDWWLGWEGKREGGSGGGWES